MTLFELTDVGFRYQDAEAIRRLSLQIADGTRVAVVGANGSGKSTLLRLLDALYFPDAGSIRFRADALTEQAFAHEAFSQSFRRRVGLVFQNPDVQLFNPTVFDEVAFGPLQLGWPSEEVRARVEEMMRRMRLMELRDRAPQHLSGGEKKRVALASVLVMDPEVLLLDEPTAALDPRSRSEIIDLLVGWGDGSKSVITATHDLDALEEIADRCCVLDRGELVADGPPREILGDGALLDRTNLIHVHRHRHGSQLHVHPHVHRHHEHGGASPNSNPSPSPSHPSPSRSPSSSRSSDRARHDWNTD